MQLTEEQQRVIDTDGNLVINAVAGSGKTSTLIAYATSRPPSSKILYLAFNKTVKTEAIQKFTQAGTNNVRVETAHSLAYDQVVKQSNYKVVHGYKSYEWCELLNIHTNDRHIDFILANHVAKFLGCFCNSKARRIQEIDYSATVSDPKAALFVKNLYSSIERYAGEALLKMENGEIGITHDFYLKKFQLSHPVLPYDYILFDEGQDASAAMLDAFLAQSAKKIIVGDIHQQIYGWRYAINSLQQVDFPVYNLSHSFRFDEEVALIANKILGWKKHLNQPPSVKITGVGNPSEINLTKAVLGRTNLGLLVNAISKWQQGQVTKLYFEGNINTYTFADDGASLYDVLNLYNGRTNNIRDKVIAEMASIRELEEYIEKTEDHSLSLIVDVVKEFGNKLPSLINELKSHHTASKDEAEMIFSTVHKCKGMEYDQVTLLNDFITETKLKRQIEQAEKDKMNEANKDRLAEEINILYVAASRARNKLIIPPEISPLRSIEVGQPSSPAVPSFTGNSSQPNYRDQSRTYKSKWENFYSSSRPEPVTFGRKWSAEEEEKALELFGKKISVKMIAKQLGRSEYAVRKKLISMGMDVAAGSAEGGDSA